MQSIRYKSTEQAGSDKGKEVKPGTKDQILAQQHVCCFVKDYWMMQIS